MSVRLLAISPETLLIKRLQHTNDLRTMPESIADLVELLTPTILECKDIDILLPSVQTLHALGVKRLILTNCSIGKYTKRKDIKNAILQAMTPIRNCYHVQGLKLEEMPLETKNTRNYLEVTVTNCTFTGSVYTNKEVPIICRLAPSNE